MKNLNFILFAAIVILLAGCNTQKKITYFQDLNNGSVNKVLYREAITLKPEDKISILVNSPQPELAVMFNLPVISRYLGASNGGAAGQNQGVSGYTVDTEGNITFPVIGKIRAAGLNRTQLAYSIRTALDNGGQLKDAVVTVEFLNLQFSVLGEVNRPGQILIDRDKITLLDAISMAGDLTINGLRDNVTVYRQMEDGRQQTYEVNLLNSQTLLTSPVYYMQQNDLVYVHPNPMRARQSTVNGNNVLSAGFWVSVASLASSVTLLVYNLVK